MSKCLSVCPASVCPEHSINLRSFSGIPEVRYRSNLTKVIQSEPKIVKRLGLGLGTWDLGPGTWDLGPGT